MHELMETTKLRSRLMLWLRVLLGCVVGHNSVFASTFNKAALSAQNDGIQDTWHYQASYPTSRSYMSLHQTLPLHPQWRELGSLVQATRTLHTLYKNSELLHSSYHIILVCFHSCNTTQTTYPLVCITYSLIYRSVIPIFINKTAPVCFTSKYPSAQFLSICSSLLFTINTLLLSFENFTRDSLPCLFIILYMTRSSSLHQHCIIRMQ